MHPQGLLQLLAPTFHNLKFLFEAHAEKYLKLLDYHIMGKRAFTLDDLQGFGEVGEVLQQRHWVSFNNLIHEINNSTGLEFYTNVAFGEVNSYTSYVWGKYIDYSPFSITSLFNLQPPFVCALMNYRHEHKIINEEMTHVMLDTFCRPGAEWVIELGLTLRLKIAKFRQILRAYASFFMQSLEVSTNHNLFWNGV